MSLSMTTRLKRFIKDVKKNINNAEELAVINPTLFPLDDGRIENWKNALVRAEELLKLEIINDVITKRSSKSNNPNKITTHTILDPKIHMCNLFTVRGVDYHTKVSIHHIDDVQEYMDQMVTIDKAVECIAILIISSIRHRELDKFWFPLSTSVPFVRNIRYPDILNNMVIPIVNKIYKEQIKQEKEAEKLKEFKNKPVWVSIPGSKMKHMTFPNR